MEQTKYSEFFYYGESTNYARLSFILGEQS